MNPDAPLYVLDGLPFRDDLARTFGITAVKARWRADATGLPDMELRFSPEGIRTVSIHRYSVSTTMEAHYDPVGRIHELVFLDEGEITDRTEYEYDSTGTWQRQIRHRADGSTAFTTRAVRDASGRLIRSITKRNDHPNHGRPSVKPAPATKTEDFHYDHSGRLVELDMGLWGSWRFNYDAQGRLRLKEGELPNSSICGNGLALEYDARGLPTRLVRPPVGDFACGTLTLEYVFAAPSRTP